MAAIDAFLELEPVEQLGAGPLAAAPGCSPASAASAGTAVTGLWAFKQAPAEAAKQARPLKRQRQMDAYSTDEEEGGSDSEGEQLSDSPGCSYSAAAGLADGLLDLEEHACSAPAAAAAAAAVAAQQQQQQQQQQAVQLADGTQLVAATFWDDLAAGGSVFRYCLRQ